MISVIVTVSATVLVIAGIAFLFWGFSALDKELDKLGSTDVKKN